MSTGGGIARAIAAFASLLPLASLSADCGHIENDFSAHSEHVVTTLVDATPSRYGITIVATGSAGVYDGAIEIGIDDTLLNHGDFEPPPATVIVRLECEPVMSSSGDGTDERDLTDTTSNDRSLYVPNVADPPYTVACMFEAHAPEGLPREFQLEWWVSVHATGGRRGDRMELAITVEPLPP